MCSLLDVVAEANTDIQGFFNTHKSQAMFIMKEVRTSSKRRVATSAYPIEPILATMRREKIPRRRTIRRGRKPCETLEVLGIKGLGGANKTGERICELLDPRRKSCSAVHIVNGSIQVKANAKSDLNAVADIFVEVGAEVRVRAFPSAAAPARGGCGSGSQEPTKKKARLAVLEQKRSDRLAKAQGEREAEHTHSTGGAWRRVIKQRWTAFRF